MPKGKFVGPRGFACMDADVQKRIARKGGLAASVDSDHMSKIGAKGGRNAGKAKKASAKERLKAILAGSKITSKGKGQAK